MFTSLAGRSAIVTGASKGIGRGIAAGLAAQGARVTLAARGASALEDTRAALAATGAQVRTRVCDVANWDQVRAMVDEAAAAQGGLSILCAMRASIRRHPWPSWTPRNGTMSWP